MLEVQQLTIEQNGQRLWDSVSFHVSAGERQGISAPSGYGKTTLGRVLAQWQGATSGRITVDAKPLAKQGYCPIQLVPQHPELTFNPYRSTGDSLRDAWSPTAAWLDRLAISPAWLKRRPDELSGGELARIALLRALDPRTRFLIADEVTAQLDAHIQAQVWHVLLDEVRRRDLGLIVFSHNKALLEKVCSSIWYPQGQGPQCGLATIPYSSQ
ncbi:ATP-binding cassette domain-containing protein [Pseudomonas lundensis]|uniref:ATP-binding cassette domain-containing protein n=1 Tax=Pseudomonas TaxID=286 RepID=UPI000641B15E|nr:MULTISPECIES: ATP-binding cassette domain-containing protein [Pseudomonas]NNA13275.1 ATP-binding cassette domain-containing protein [Pseudomonas lundensis]QVQ77494.1 ATP-binding cassette domain-containing protein [Pseudomonas lundensis]QVQ83437.1 ATP-binding cassette domain-containing protein [Pseudomonas lundensis]